MTDKERIDYLYELLGLETSLHTRAGKIAPALNEIEMRPYGPRRSLDERRWGGVELISRNQTPTSAQLKKNNAALKRALNSAEPLQMPRVRKQGAVLCISDPVIVQDMPVDLLGFTEGCIIRVVDNVHGMELSNRSRLYTKHLRNLILEIANADYLEEWSTRVHAIRMGDSIGYGFDGTAYDKPDNVVLKRSAVIENVQVRGSDMYFSDRPWQNGFHGGIYIENPQSVVIRDFVMQGLGERYTGWAANRNSDFGIYFEADRLSTDSLIDNPVISNAKVLVDLYGNGYTGFPSLEGVTINDPVLLSSEIGVRIRNTKYRAPAFVIQGGKITADRYCVYQSNIEQGQIVGVDMYNFGHNQPGDCAFIYLDNAVSNTNVSNNVCIYQYDRPVTKDPYGIIARGFNKEVFYGEGFTLAPGEDPIEYSVNNRITNNQFVGDASAEIPKAAIWMQASDRGYKIRSNEKENYAQMVKTDLPQGVVSGNYPADPVQSGTTPVVNNERQVIEIPVPDEFGDPTEVMQRVIVNRLNEGVVLVPFTGTITANRAASNGLIVAIAVGGDADPDGYIIDGQFARSELVEIRADYISGINETDPDNPVEIVSDFEDKNIRGFALQFGQRIRLETKVAILLKYNVDLLPLRDKKDLILKPGDWIEFQNTKNGIEEISRFAGPQVTDTLDNLSGLMQYVLDDAAGSPHIWPDPTGYNTWTVYNRRYKSPGGNVFEDQWLVNVKSGTILHRVKHDTGVTPWTQLSGPSVFTMTADGILSDVPYLLQATIEGKSLWHLRQTEYITVDNVRHLNQVAYDDDGTMCILRSKIGSGAWTKWQKIGSRLIDGMSQITNRDFGVYIDEYDNLQVGAKSTSGAEYKLLRDPPTVSQSLVTGSDFLLMYDNASKRWYKITEDDQITIIRRVTDSIYLRRNNIPTVASFTTNHKQIRYDITTGQLVRLA